LTVIKSKDHPLASALNNAITLNLKHLSDAQENDGSWAPTWSWFGHFDEAWPLAERDSRSMVTADALITLHRFSEASD